MPKLYRDAATGHYTTAEDAAARPAETVSESVPARHETPDVAELRRLLANVGAHWQEMPSGYPPDLYGWEVHELTSPGLGDLDVTGGGLPEGTARLIAAAVNALPTLLDRLAHMREARDNARAEVERLTAQVEAVREWATDCATQATDYDKDTEQQIEDGREVLRILDGGAES